MRQAPKIRNKKCKLFIKYYFHLRIIVIAEHIYILSLADIIEYIKSKPIYSMKELQMLISYDDFEKVDLRSGTITKVEEFARAKKPSYKIWVDFGSEIGIKQTSAQI